MKGEIFNLLEKFIIQNQSIDFFEEIIEEVKNQLETKEPFVGPETCGYYGIDD